MQLTSPTVLSPRKVGQLEGRFFVPDYQRGYRWGPGEVRALLEDIKAANGEDYYLQPIVVKPRSDGSWELVDGQQRLTTLYLAMRSLQEYLPKSKIRYSIEYQTRPGSAKFLDKPRRKVSGKNIDFFHMFAAWETIQDWLEKQPDATDAANKLHTALVNTVRVIWYQAPDEPGFASRDLFTRLNVGRIPLTDAELVKAALLSGIDPRHQHETAAQWDTIERDLWSPEVWAFATGRAHGPATRIELLLDTVADRRAGRPSSSHRPPFQTFETLRPCLDTPKGAKTLWEEVVDLHSLILGWYEDRDLFHRIGYLIAARQATFRQLVDLAQNLTRSAFDDALRGLIAKGLNLSWHGIQSLRYGSAKTNRVLLLMNVEAVREVRNSSERYSFDAHAKRLWSLEHIHAQHSEGLNTVEQWTAWLVAHRKALAVLDLPAEDLAAVVKRIDEALPRISKESFECLHTEIVDVFSAPADSGAGAPEHADLDEVDSIANLALLARDDNSVLNNSVFEIKRRHLIALDRAGSYIPLCTRNVFLKYYNDSANQQLHFWSSEDRAGYLSEMERLLRRYLLPDVPENEELEESVDEAMEDAG